MLRRKSPDSSNSSGSESGGDRGHPKVKKDKKDKDKKDKDKKDKDKDKDKKDKKDKSDKKDKDKDHKDHKAKGDGSTPGFPQPPAYPQGGSSQPAYGQPPTKAPSAPMSYGFNDPNADFPSAHNVVPQPQFVPHVAAAAAPPPSGYRVPLSGDAPFPSNAQTGWPPLYDADGTSPIFIGSALFDNSVHPCKIGPHLNPHAAVAYGGKEQGHAGRYDLLPFVPEQMEWVPTSQGRIPPGRRPIEGGYEDNGNKLYHALAVVQGTRIPGKTGEHL